MRSLEFKELLGRILEQSFLLQSPANAYSSEASVQLKFGLELWKSLESEPRLEYYYQPSNSYLDIFVNADGCRYGIELKYKTKTQSGFPYKNQGAQNNGLYFFLADVARIESFKAAGIIDEGFSILLTNDPAYWSKKRSGSLVQPFELIDGGTIQGTYTPTWKVDSESCPPLHLSGSHAIRWLQPTSASENEGVFRALVI
jgi:hypothetical protein